MDIHNIRAQAYRSYTAIDELIARLHATDSLDAAEAAAAKRNASIAKSQIEVILYILDKA